jgi:long-chain acyl-CoA synthetase
VTAETTPQTLRARLDGATLRWRGDGSALERAVRALAASRGATLAPPANDAPADLTVLALTAPANDLRAALAEVSRVEDALRQAERTDGRLLVISSLEVLGAREGSLFESHPARPPFPHAKTRGEAHWDLAREVESARSELEAVLRRVRQGDVVGALTVDARAALTRAKLPARGAALDSEVSEALAAREEEALTTAARTRARAWGFSTVRGWAHALCEQLVATSGRPFTVVRCGAIGAARRGEELSLDDTLDDEIDGVLGAWALASRAGPVRPPAPDAARLELMPIDDVAAAILVALTHLVVGDPPATFHAIATAENALTIGRVADLVDLATRPARSDKPRGLLARLTSAAERARRAVDAAEVELESSALLLSPDQRPRGRNLQASERRLLRDEPPLFSPRDIDWRRWLIDRQLPAATALAAPPAPPVVLRSYDSLVQLLEEGAERFASRPALTHFLGDDRVDVSYRELLARARAVAKRLDDQGVGRGDRVYLSGRNGPDWVISFFGVVLSGAACVPLDPALTADQVRVIHGKAKGARWITDDSAEGVREVLGDGWELHLAAASGPPGGVSEHDVDREELASILFTSGTTGEPKGVMLSHRNFTSLVASLGDVFDMHGDDRLLSVLPLHHTFEFSCGLLLPLVAGAHIHYLDELTGERLLYALREGRVTAMVGVPALWQLLERRLRKRIEDQPAPLRAIFDAGLGLNRALAERTGRDVGKLLFKRVHDELGGHLRTVISGGAALPGEVHELFHGLGLPIAEGYGLTEAAPVLTVAEPAAGVAHGSVGRPVPGVELRIDAPDARGVGEVLARGPNVMQGYFENEAATAAALDDGWLRTGDLGRIDEDGALTLVGRAKDVVVTAAGENIYLDDVEARLGEIAGVSELTLIGVPDARGGERLALVYTLADGDDDGEAALADEVAKLPPVFRPQVTRAFDEDELPRTATRKVKRKEVARWLTDALERDAARSADDADEAPLAVVRAGIALAAGVEVRALSASTDLYADLGFDSLMWVELQGALQPAVGAIDAEELARCRTVAEVEAYARRASSADPRQREPSSAAGDESTGGVTLPDFAWRPARRALATAQRELYRALYATEVEGRANIPQNRSCIVIANHTSHLDTGLVKYALGPYGRKLTPLAARDYFFAGHPLKVAFFENLTNLEPIDRETGSGRAFEQAVDVVERGHVVLIFPEGTRRPDGTLGEFKPLVAKLSLKTGVDVLPMYLSGAYDAFPKGASVPRPGKLQVRIGPPLQASELRRLTAELSPVQAARAATTIIRDAVVALGEGRAVELSQLSALDAGGQPSPSAARTRRA